MQMSTRLVLLCAVLQQSTGYFSLLYDVDPRERFNSRHSYVNRALSLAQSLNQHQESTTSRNNWTVVLPPFHYMTSGSDQVQWTQWSSVFESSALPYSNVIGDGAFFESPRVPKAADSAASISVVLFLWRGHESQAHPDTHCPLNHSVGGTRLQAQALMLRAHF